MHATTLVLPMVFLIACTAAGPPEKRASAPTCDPVVGRDFGPGGQIVFHADPGGDSELHLTDQQRAEPTLLTDSVRGHPFGQWSPDGSRVAFLSGSSGTGTLYIVDADGSNERSLTSIEIVGFSWAPDGTRLVVDAAADGGIYVVDADGSDEKRISPHGYGSRWSPDCRRIVFFSDHEGDHEIYVMDVNGGHETRLTEDPGADLSPVWSPDGRLVAFVSDRDGDFEVHVMNADGTNVAQLTTNRRHDEHLEWSPDARRILYVSYLDGADPQQLGIGNAEVFSVGLEGSSAVNLSKHPAWDGDASWSPDGTMIVFTRRDGPGEIFVMRADGSDQVWLPGLRERFVNDCCADWQPTPN
jgi:Tol biopolymer transport system component